jgi:MYXO-CTERM domain-containing protein
VATALLVTTSRLASAAPLLFDEKTPNLGVHQPCFDPAHPDQEGCYSNYVVLADLNADGHLDIVFANGGGYFVPAGPAPLAVYYNDGKGAFRDVAGAAFGGFAGRVRQIAVGDIDGDGDLDLYVPGGYGLESDALFVNDGKPHPGFTNEAASRLPLSSHAGAVRMGDVNGDGALDIVIADWGNSPPASRGTVRVYLNDGKGTFREKVGALVGEAPVRGTGPVDLDLFDADGDFDLDILVANRKGSSELLRGDGTGSFTNDESFPRQPGPYVYGPDECDVDGDGDLDIWLDNGGLNDTEQLLINDGKGHFTDETEARVHGNPTFVDDNVVRCADVNGDGALDAVIGSLSGDRRVLLNDGKGVFTLQAGAFPAQKIATLGLDLGDLDGDGRLDVVTAQGEKGPFLNRLYFGTAAVAVDVIPPIVRQLQRLADGTPQGTSVVRFAVRDNVTTDTGPRLRKASLETETEVIPAVFVGGDLFRAMLHIGSAPITYRACATDWAGNRGCSAPVTFVPQGARARGSSCASSHASCSSRPGGGTPPFAALLASLVAAGAVARRRYQSTRR